MIAIAAGTGTGCGNVTFVDAPFAPRHIDVLYSVQENVTAIRWRVGAEDPDPNVRFELLDAHGKWQPVDFASSVYFGGLNRCRDKKGGLCAQMVVPGQYRPPEDALTPVRSRNPTFDVSPGDQPALHDYATTLALSTYFSRNNLGLVTTIQDVIGGDPTFVFPRPLERAVWERGGVCVPGFFPPATQFAEVTGLGDAWPSPAPLSDTGAYCAAVRAVKTTGDRGTDVQLAIDTVPEVFNGDHRFKVPTETTPFSYQIVLDLSIPVADRCQEAITAIQSVVSSKIGKYSQLRAQPVIDLSTTDPETGGAGMPCRQSALRALEAGKVAQDVKVVAAGWKEQHQRFFLLYFNNLRAPLPTPLMDSLDAFDQIIVNPPPTIDFQATIWPFGPQEMVDSFKDRAVMTPQAWESATDPAFATDLEAWAAGSLPLVSEVPDPSKPIPILDSTDLPGLDGGFLRLCEYSITPIQGTGLKMMAHDDAGGLVTLLPDYQYAVHADDPPAYVMDLPAVWAVPMPGFSPHQSHIRYEVCTRYCTHPFTSESGAPVSTGWIGNSQCVGPPSGGKG